MTLHRQNIGLLRQGIDLLRSLDVSLYGPTAGHSGIGAHLRHCIDSYHCFLSGLDADERIDYDARSRDRRVEREPVVASRALADLVDRLEQLEQLGFDLDLPIRVKVDTPSGEEACWQRSSLGRELQFLISHTTHHFALIAILLRGRGLDPGADFGVAASTLAHRDQAAVCAQ